MPRDSRRDRAGAVSIDPQRPLPLDDQIVQGLRRHRQGARRSPLAPEVPTIDEAGVKGYEMGYWFAAYVPAKTPPAVVDRLNELLVKAARSASAQSAFYGPTGTEVFTTSPPDLARFQSDEAQKWGRIVKAAGIEAE